MRRGTTPTLRCKIRGIRVSELDQVWITIRQKSYEVTKTLEDIIVNDFNNAFDVYLTQEETLGFHTGEVRVQLRALKDDVAIASNIVDSEMKKILKEGVIS